MSDWKTSRHASEIKKLYTESNLNTNTSFEFTQTLPFNDFSSFHQNSIVENPREELHRSVIFIKDPQMNNDSCFSLQPTVTPQQVNEFLVLIEMIKFFDAEAREKRQLIKNKKTNVARLEEFVNDVEERISIQKASFQRKKEEFTRKKLRLANFKKKKSRALTEEVERMSYEIKNMLRCRKTRGSDRTYMAQSSSFIRIHEQSKSNHEKQSRARVNTVYVPYYPPYNQYPLHYGQTNINAKNCIPPYQQSFLNPPIPSPRVFTSHHIDNEQTKLKQPIIMSQLREAITMKMNPNDRADTPIQNLDYFNTQFDTPKSRNDKKNIQTPRQLIRKSNNSVKWKKADNEDKELVEIISNSIKYIKTQESQEEEYQFTQAKEPKTKQTDSRTIRKCQNTPNKQEQLLMERVNRNSDSSQINITYDSQDKRNSKSFESKDDSHDRRKKSSKTSEKKSDKGKIEQSNVKIEMIDMSISKNSVSSKSDSSKHAANRYVPSLNQHFHDIEEESEELLSLKATPIENKLKTSMENHKSQNSKNLKKQTQKEVQSPQYANQTPPKPIERQQYEQDEILRSIRLDTQSRISKKKYLDNLSMKKEEYDEDDILDGITLLKESRASREKGLSLKSSISRMQELIYDQDLKEEKGSQSEIFNKIENEEVKMLNSSLRSSTKSKIVKTRNRNQTIDLVKRGCTEPLRGQLTSIPSAQFEEEQEDSPPNSKNRPKNNQSST